MPFSVSRSLHVWCSYQKRLEVMLLENESWLWSNRKLRCQMKQSSKAVALPPFAAAAWLPAMLGRICLIFTQWTATALGEHVQVEKIWLPNKDEWKPGQRSHNFSSCLGKIKATISCFLVRVVITLAFSQK